MPKRSWSQKVMCNKPTKLQFQLILIRKTLMLPKRYESTEVDGRTWLHVPRFVSFWLNRTYMKIRTPNSCGTDNTSFLEYFYVFWGFVVWDISGHFGGVYQSHYCALDSAFIFFFCICNVSRYCFKSKLGNKLYLWMIYICVHLNRLHLHEKRKRSNSVPWQTPLLQQKCQKGKVTTQTTTQKNSITQRLWTDGQLE